MLFVAILAHPTRTLKLTQGELAHILEQLPVRRSGLGQVGAAQISGGPLSILRGAGSKRFGGFTCALGVRVILAQLVD